MENRFKRIMASKSDIELRKISENEDDYEDDARIAAISELEVRSNSDDNYQDIKDEINRIKNLTEEKEAKIKESRKVPEDIPTSVNWAAYFLYLTELSSLAYVFYLISIGRLIMGVIPILFYVAYKVFTILVIRSLQLKMKWARVAILVLIICWLPLAALNLLQGISMVISYGVVVATNYISLVYITLYLVAMFLLFTGKGHEWFSGRKKNVDLLDDL